MSSKWSDPYSSRNGGHTEIRDRLDPVVYGEPIQNAPLSPEDRAFYEENGYLFFPNFFQDDEVVRLQAALKQLRLDPALSEEDFTITEYGSGDIRSIFKVHEIDDTYSRLCRDPRLVEMAQYLLDDDVYIHQSRVNYKPGFRGREFYWHSDFETWHIEDGMPRMRAVSMSIIMSENLEWNGPLMLIPGSHKYYVSCPGETPENHYKQSLKRQEFGIPDDDSLNRLVAEGGITMPKGAPGSLLLFDCNVMHGSNSNITPYPRSNVFFVFNSMKNRVVEPFGGMKPRPEFLSAREDVHPIEPEILAA